MFRAKETDMATVVYTRSAYEVDTVVYDGTNVDEIITLVGASHVEQPWSDGPAQRTLRVKGEDIAVGELVAVNSETGEIQRKITPARRDTEYVPV